MAHQDIDQRVEVEHEHTLKVEGIGGMGWICALGLIVALMFEGEIRCSLGNQRECVKMTPKPAEIIAPKP